MCSLSARVDVIDRLPTSASCSSWSRTMVSRNGTSTTSTSSEDTTAEEAALTAGSALAQAEPEPAVEPTRPAAEPVGTTGLEAGATRPAEPAGTLRTFKAPTKAGPAVKPESKPMPRPYAKPTPKVKAQTAEAKPVETKKEPDSAREPAAGVKAPETPPQANQPGSSSTGPGDDVTYQQTGAAYDFAALHDCLDSDDKLQKVVYLFLTRCLGPRNCHKWVSCWPSTTSS